MARAGSPLGPRVILRRRGAGVKGEESVDGIYGSNTGNERIENVLGVTPRDLTEVNLQRIADGIALFACLCPPKYGFRLESCSARSAGGVLEQVAPCGDHAIRITQIVPVDIPYGQYGQIGSHGREYVAGEIHRRESTVEPLDRFSFSPCAQHGSNPGKGLVDGRHGLLDEFQNGGRATHHDEAIPEPGTGPPGSIQP